jgi:hypothetical protein
MEITETKYEFKFGDYFARSWFGEYGTHTDWFRGEEFINSDEVPDDIIELHELKCEEIYE